MFSLQKYGGITKYFCELIKNYPVGNSYNLSLLFSDNQHLKDDFKFFKKLHFPIPQKNPRVKGFLKRNAYSINSRYSRKIIAQNKYDLFHPTYFDPYFLDYVNKPYIITVHDLIAFKYQDVHKKDTLMSNMTKIISNSNRIIAISEHTKKDLINILKVSPEKIDVIYHGFNRLDLENNTNKYGRYILYVGARLGYKNFKSLAKAFGNLSKHDDDLKLICVGPPFSKEESEELMRLKINDKTIAMGVNEHRLNQLYSHALTFIYPTQYEGFGMPILEAFANNCPVCLSNTSCLPEIAGEAGNYFDPNNPESICDTIERVIYDPEFSRKMSHAGNERLRYFSWEKCAQQTIESYEKAVL